MTAAPACAPASPQPVVLAVAPNGAYRTQAEHGAVPVTTSQIVATAVACREAGASLLHLHVRDDAGRHTLDASAYLRACAAIRSELGEELVVQITTESAGMYGPAAQMEVVKRVRPEAVSLSIRELVRERTDVARFGAFLTSLRHEGIAAQFILYDESDVRHLLRLRAEGAVPNPSPFVLFVLGSRTQPWVGCGDLVDRVAMLSDVGGWMTCAFGAAETRAAVASGALGGHARIGFENSIHNADGSIARDNAERVRRVRSALESIGCRPATPTHVRALLHSTL